MREAIEYWETRVNEADIGVDWIDAHERCWRCGFKSKTDKCHIIPDSLGGSSSPENIVLLCRRCHREAPNVSDPRLMWEWIKSTSVPFYESYWYQRGIDEFRSIFGRNPFEGVNLPPKAEKEARIAVKDHLKGAIIHWGEGGINPSTIASVFALVEESLARSLPQRS